MLDAPPNRVRRRRTHHYHHHPAGATLITKSTMRNHTGGGTGQREVETKLELRRRHPDYDLVQGVVLSILKNGFGKPSGRNIPIPAALSSPELLQRQRTIGPSNGGSCSYLTDYNESSREADRSSG
ncbi:MAG: hypothetical protein ACLT8E_01080 [Akkermansia sp.]